MTETVELWNGENRRVVEVRRCATCSFVSYRDPETGYDYTPYVWARMGWHPTDEGFVMSPGDVFTTVCLYLSAGAGICFLVGLACVKYEQWADDRDAEEEARRRRREE